MNIFYLDSDPLTCARYHCDKHVIKMILESCQLMATAHRLLDFDINDWHDSEGFYRVTHRNHPSARWVRLSSHHYTYLWYLTKHLCHEYTYRYPGRVHKCQQYVDTIYRDPPQNIFDDPFVEPPACMPVQYIIGGDAVQSYRRYYVGAKQDILQYTRRPPPAWLDTTESDHG